MLSPEEPIKEINSLNFNNKIDNTPSASKINIKSIENSKSNDKLDKNNDGINLLEEKREFKLGNNINNILEYQIFNDKDTENGTLKNNLITYNKN